MNTHFTTFGEGPRQALALHCTLAHGGAWRAVGIELNDLLTITAVDMPGHGRSADWTGQGDLHTAWAGSALPFLQTPTDLIGHSFGATVALRLAVEHPMKVRSLTLIEPVFFAAAITDAPAEAAAHTQEAQPYQDALDAGDMIQAARLFNRLWGDGTRWQDFRPSARQYMADRMHMIPAQTPSIVNDSVGLLRPGRLDRATMPCLLVQGGASPPIIRAINKSLLARLPDARLASIDTAGHMSPMTHPREVAAEIRALLEVT